MNDVLGRGAYVEAAAMSRRLLRGNAAKWEQLVYAFDPRQLPKLAPHVPTGAPHVLPLYCHWALQLSYMYPLVRPMYCYRALQPCYRPMTCCRVHMHMLEAISACSLSSVPAGV